MNVFWRRVGITAATAIAVAGVVPGTAQADSVARYTCEYVSPVMLTPIGSYATTNGCEGPAGSHNPVVFDDAPPSSADICMRGDASPQSDGKMYVIGWDCFF